MVRAHLLVLAFTAIAAAPAFAADGDAPVRYDQHKIVTVYNTSWDEVASLHALGARLLSCNEGLGPVDYVVPPDAMPALAALGVEYRVVNNNIQDLIDAERAEIDAAPRDTRDATWFLAYKDPNAILTRMQQMAADRPDLVTIFSIGTTFENRNIWAMRISGSAAVKPGVLFNSAQHAREWISPMTTMWIADRLVSEYGVNTELTALVDSLEFYIIPVTNPDGYAYTWSTERLWRKNRRTNLGSSCRGADDNRNWGAQWGGEGASTDPCAEDYRGFAAFSEFETQAMRDFETAHPQLVASIDFHSYSQLIMSPYGYTSALPPDNDLFLQVDAAMHDAILGVHGVNYAYGPIYTTIYPASGSAVDWGYIARGIFAFTIELRPADASGGGFELPAAQIIPTCEENFPAAMYLAQWSTSPVKFNFPNGRPAQIVAAQPTNLDVNIRVVGGTLNTSSPTLYARDHANAPFQAYAMMLVSGNVYRAVLPPTICGRTLQYYVQASTSAGVVGVTPAGAPANVYSADAVEVTVVFQDNFETDMGWTTAVAGATSGQWQRGVPVNDPGWAYDPITDGDGSGKCYLTQNAVGNTDVDNGSVILTSPTINMSSGDITLDYDYYLYLTIEDGADYLRLDVNSNNGVGSWITVANHTTSGGTNWRHNTITPAQFAAAGVTFTPTMKLRFTAIDAGTQSIVEGGVDGVRVAHLGCSAPALCAGDLNCDGAVDFADIDAFVAALGGEAPYLAQYPDCQWLNADTNGDLSVDFADIDPFVALIGSTCP